MTSKNYLLKVIICVILIFSTVGAAFSAVAFSSVLSEKYYDKIIDKYDISQKVYDSIESEFESNSHSSGIDASVYMDNITQESLEEMIKANVKAGLDYLKGKSDSYDYIENLELYELNNGIDEFFGEFDDNEKNDEYYEKLNQIKEEADSIVKEKIDIFKFSTLNSSGTLGKLRSLYSKVSPLLIGVFVLFAVMFILMVIVAKAGEAYYWIGCDFLASGILILIPCIYLSASGLIQSFVIKDSGVYYAVTGLLTGTEKMLIKSGVWFIVLGVCDMALKVYFIIRKSKDSKSEKKV